MLKKSHLNWTPDLRLPAGSGTNLQEFISHDKETVLRVNVARQSAEVEVNDRVVAKTTSFPEAAALAELYLRDGEMLLAKKPAESVTETTGQTYYHLRADGGACKVFASTDPGTLVDEEERVPALATAKSLVAALAEAEAAAGGPLVPAFADQDEVLRGLGQEGAGALVVALWVSHWQMPFIPIIQEDEYSPLSLDVATAPDGAHYAIYRLVNREYLAEVRSHHDAEEVGRFISISLARAYCNLFNAARHSERWVTFAASPDREQTSDDGGYVLTKDEGAFRLSTAGAEALALGHFATVRLAEAYATAHRDAMAHFAPKGT